MFIKAIEAACEEIPAAEDVSAETPSVKWQIHPSARKVDALAVMAETFLAQGPAALKGESNLVSLCRFHHRQVHQGDVVVLVLDDGAIRFVTPTGESFDSTLQNHTQPLSDWQQLVATHEKQGLHIDRRTAATGWDGETYDHAWAIESLLRRLRTG